MSKRGLELDKHVQELAEALEAARAALQAQSESDLADTPSVKALERAHISAVQAASRIGEQLVRDRLSMEEAGPASEELSLASIATDLRSELASEAEARGVTLEFDPQPDVRVIADRELLKRALSSVLLAALRIMDEGDHLEVESVAETDGALLRIHSPSGDLSTKTVPHLLDGRSPQAKEVVTGPPDLEVLALRPRVEAQGGRVWIEQEGQIGSALCIRLPVAAEPRPQPEATAKGTVLIVDDDPDGAQLLEQALIKNGYRTLVAHDGLSGLKMAGSPEVSIVLLDVMLPGLDGFEVCRRLRAEPASADLPIIMLSAKSRPEDREMGLKMGADQYLNKPVRLAEVLELVSAHIGEPEGDG